MGEYVATIYRTTAMCGIRGDVMPSAAKAIRSAEIKAGRLFILGRSATQHDRFWTGQNAIHGGGRATRHCSNAPAQVPCGTLYRDGWRARLFARGGAGLTLIERRCGAASMNARHSKTSELELTSNLDASKNC